MAERGSRGPGRGPGRGQDERPRSRGRGATQEAWDAETATHVRTEGGGFRPPAQRAPAEEAPAEQTAARPAAPATPRKPRRPRRTKRSTEERNRRRFARRQWARRWLAWRAVLVVVVLLAAATAAGWVVLVSSLLAVEDVEVSGTELLDQQQVTNAAAVSTGEPLARVDLEAIERRVEALAEVQEATVTRSWPNAVDVSVTEREAIAVVEMSGRLRGMDDQGVLFREFDKAAPALPRVVMPTGTTSEAMVEAARVIEALPGDLVPRVDHVEVDSVDAISLVLRGDRRVVWGSAEESEAKAEVVDALLAAVPAAVYDVSVPGQPTTTQQP